MNWKTLILGIAAGFACGYATKQVLEQSGPPSPERILDIVKASVKKDGKIYGSWILMKPETYQKYDLDYEVYKGGITRSMNNTQEQFEFVADATTGTIIDLVPQK